MGGGLIDAGAFHAPCDFGGRPSILLGESAHMIVALAGIEVNFRQAVSPSDLVLAHWNTAPKTTIRSAKATMSTRKSARVMSFGVGIVSRVARAVNVKIPAEIVPLERF